MTNIGPSIISGDLGVSPGSAVTGFAPGNVINGTQHVTDAVAAKAQLGVTAAYKDAFSRSPFTSVPVDLTGLSLGPGVYRGGSLGLSGTVTLDAYGNPDAVFVFQAASTLVTSTASVVSLIGDASACNVYWQIGSSATLGTASTFVGTVMALTSISAGTNATVQGRLLARKGAVTLDTNTISAPNCTSRSEAEPAVRAPAGRARQDPPRPEAARRRRAPGPAPARPALPCQPCPRRGRRLDPRDRQPFDHLVTDHCEQQPAAENLHRKHDGSAEPHSRPPALTGSNLLPTTAAGLAALALGGLLMRLGRRSTHATARTRAGRRPELQPR
ncbi:MAG: ice-binding family protein [Jatrophihabitans sp.]|uniref:ice-binding family protein n=1 Tax=Jatrophihabitans sp. TaxID=1932789 RepID=UPI003914A696